MKYVKKIVIASGIGLILLFLSLVGLGVRGTVTPVPVAATAPVAVAPTVTAPTVQEPDLLALAQSFKMDTTNLNLVYGTFADANQYAEFDWRNVNNQLTYTITVKPDQTSNASRVALAHEYYHYVWYTHPDLKTRVIPTLDTLYASDMPMHDRMLFYLDRQMTPGTEAFDNELFAIYCSEVYTASLPTVIGNECRTWESLSPIQAYRSL